MEKIKVTNSYLDILARGALAGLTGKQIPAKLAYHVTRFTEKATPEVKALNAARQNAIKECAKTENGDIVMDERNNIQWNEGGEKKFQEKMQEILDMEIEFDMEKLPVDFNEIPLVTLNEMSILAPLIVDEDELD